MSRFAVICATGIGDALILSIASHHLRTLGHEVTTFSRHLPSFGRWLEPGGYLPLPADWASVLTSFDAIVLQHENSLIARQIVSLRASGQKVYVLYTNYLYTKHGALLDGLDYPYNHTETMVDNTCQAMSKLFGGAVTMHNGLFPPPYLVHRKYDRRILIHPTSGSAARNWPREKFIKLAKKIKQLSYHPTFIVSPEEQQDWNSEDAPVLTTLEDLASLIYESGGFIGNDSGPGHLASYLSIPHLIISGQANHMQLWRPGWHRGEIVLPPRWVPNFKGFRIRENKWKYFISTNDVLKRFRSMVN